MGTTLTGKRVQNTYDSLLKLSDNDNLLGTAKIVGDGLGNDSPIYLSTTQVGIGVTPSFQFHTSSHAKIGGNLTVAGNLTVDGTTTIVDSTVVAIGDNMIELAKDNVANVKDIGWYGTINSSGEKYVGMFYDASSGVTTPTFAIGLGTSEPSSTATWTTKGKLVIGALDASTGVFSGQVTIPITPVANTDAASKGYVDAQITAQDLDIAGDSGTGAIDLDSQTFTIAGGTNVTTSVSNQTVTINASGGIDGSGTANDVVMWQDADTLTDAPIAISGVNATFAGDITISNATPSLTLTDTDNSSNISFSSIGGALVVNSTSDQVYQMLGTEKFRIGVSTATFTGQVIIQDNTSQPLSNLFEGTLVVQGSTNEDPIIAITDVNTANAAAGVFHQSSTSPGFPALVINAASNGSEQPLISARTNVNNTTGVGGTEVFAVDGDGDATFAGSITTNLSSAGTYFTGGSGGVRQLSITSGTNISAHALHTFNIASSNGKYEFDIDGTTKLSLDSSSATFAGNVNISGGNVQIGSGHNTASAGNAIIFASYGTGTNIAGGELQLYGGRSTGSAAGGSIKFYTSPTGSSGSSANAHIQALSIDSSQNATFASNVSTTLGNLSINGTGFFASTLTVRTSNSNILTLDRTTSAGGYMRFQNDGTDKFYIGSRGTISGDGGTGYDLYTVGGNDIRFFAGTLKTLTLDTSANATFAGKVGVAGTTMNANHANFSVNLAQTSGTLTTNNYAHFGSQAHSSGAIMGITLGYKESANLLYRKVALVAEGMADNAARQHFHILVDNVNDANSVQKSDSKLKINGLTGDVTIPTRVGIGIDPPTATLHVSDASNSGVTTISANDRIKLSGDGVLRWGPSANYGILTWDTNKAVVGGQSGSTLELKSGSTFGLEIDTAGDINSPDLLYMRQTRFGYSAAYKVAQFGNAAATSAISLGYNPSGNTDGGFSGNEILIPNNRRILAPKNSDSGFMGVLMYNTSDHLLIGGTNYNMDSTFALRTRGTGTGVIIRGGGTHVANENIGEFKIGYAYASSGGAPGSATRLAIQPYAHTGGPWVFIARDTASSAFLDIGYSARQWTFKHNGFFGFNTDDPTAPLSIDGIRLGRDWSINNRATIRLDSKATNAPSDILFGHTAAANELSWTGVYWAMSSRGTSAAGKFYIYRGSGQASPFNSESVLLTFTPNLRVGLNNTDPQADLHITSSTTAKLRLNTTGVADASIEILGYDAGLHIGDNTNGNRWAIWNDGPSTSSSLKIGSYALGTWYLDGSQVVTLTSSGLAGIGQVSPSRRLDVLGVTGNTLTARFQAQGSTTDAIVDIEAERDTYLRFRPANTDKWSIVADYPSAGDLTFFDYLASDIRVKIVNTNMTGGWDESLRINNQYPVLSFQSDAGPGYYAGLGYDGGYGLRFYLGASGTDITGTGTHAGFADTSGRWVLGAGSTSTTGAYALTVAGVNGSYASAVKFASGSSHFFVGAVSISNTNNFELWNSAAGYIRFATSSVERMQLDAGGDLYLKGQANPTLYFQTNTTTSTNMFIIESASYVGSAPFNANRIIANNSSSIAFEAAGAEGMRIDGIYRRIASSDDGSVFTPATRAHFKDISDAQLTLEGRASSWAGIKWQDVNGSAFTWFYGATQTWAFGGGGSAVSGKRIHCDGGMTIGSGYDGVTMPTNGLWVQGTIKCADDLVAFDSSDKRLKDDIKKIEKPLDKLDKINGYKFKWNDNQEIHEGEDYGVIAQEVKEVMPEIVNLKESGYYGVKYDKLIPLLIESIKELKAEVEFLKNK